MNKYDPLFNYLKAKESKYVILNYIDIEGIISDKLPSSAYKYRAWWANGGHIQANSWLDAGWKVQFVKLVEHVEFTK
jgi:hypothetical protein